MAGVIIAGLTLEQLIPLLSGAGGAILDGIKIWEELHKLGVKPGDPIPASHIARAQSVVDRLHAPLSLPMPTPYDTKGETLAQKEANHPSG